MQRIETSYPTGNLVLQGAESWIMSLGCTNNLCYTSRSIRACFHLYLPLLKFVSKGIAC